MSKRTIIPFKQHAIRRALKGAQEAGLNPTEITISPVGDIVLRFDGITTNNTQDSYDKWANSRGKIAA